jgi:hypothetical protein
MAGCDVLYYDPGHVDRDPASPRPGQRWVAAVSSA